MNGLTVAFTGRVTHDPEARFTRTGKAMLQVSLTVDQNSVATEERAAPEPVFVRATLWEALADQLADQLRNGSSV